MRREDLNDFSECAFALQSALNTFMQNNVVCAMGGGAILKTNRFKKWLIGFAESIEKA